MRADPARSGDVTQPTTTRSRSPRRRTSWRARGRGPTCSPGSTPAVRAGRGGARPRPRVDLRPDSLAIAVDRAHAPSITHVIDDVQATAAAGAGRAVPVR